jgi:hypothetical protein
MDQKEEKRIAENLAGGFGALLDRIGTESRRSDVDEKPSRTAR